MSKNYFPFQDTSISADRSIGEIVGLLKEVGFDRIAQIYDQGADAVIAVYRGTEFVFQADSKKIADVLWDRYNGHSKTREDFEEQAKRIAWRILWNQVKNQSDVIKYEVAPVSSVFGGYLSFHDQQGKRTTLAELITSEIEAGRIEPARMISGLLPRK